MKYWAMMGTALLTMAMVAPASAVPQPNTEGELQRRLVDVCWELHDLTYSDVATAQQREAKRQELATIERSLHKLQSLPRLSDASTPAEARQVVDAPVAPAAMMAAVSIEPSPVLALPSTSRVAVVTVDALPQS